MPSISPAVSAKDLLLAAIPELYWGPDDEAQSGQVWAVRVGHMTDFPAQQVGLYDTGGLTPNPRWLLDYPTIQALVRGNTFDYPAAYGMAKKVKDTLLGLESQDLNGDRWVSVTGLGDITFLKVDDKTRPLISVNFRLILEPATAVPGNRDPL